MLSGVPEPPPQPRSRGPAEGSGARIVRNTIANAAGRSSAVVVSILLTPLLIDRLGLAEYGVWVLAVSLTVAAGYLSLADLGLELSAGRFISTARAQGDVRRMNAVLSTALALFTAIGLVLGPLVAVCAGLLAAAFEIPPELEDAARIAFALVAVQLVFDLPGRAFITLLTGSQLHTRWQALEAGRAAVSAGVYALLVVDGHGVEALAAASLALAAVSLAVYAAVALRSVPEAACSLRLVSRGIARELATFGGQVLIVRIADTVYRQADKTIIGVMLATTAVGVYEIAFNLSLGVSMVLGVTTSALFPAAAYVSADRARMRALFLRSSAYILAVVAPVLVVAVGFAEPIIDAWVGSALEDAADPTRILMAAVALQALCMGGQTMLMSIGRARPVVLCATGGLLLNVPVSIALANPLGLEGVALGTLLSQAVVAPLLLRTILREFGVSAAEWFTTVVRPVLLPVVAQALAVLALLPYVDGLGSLALVLGVGALTMVPAFAVYAVVSLSAQQRSELLAVLRGALGRSPGVPAR